MRTNIVDPLPYPAHLDIELTNYCMVDCEMCPRRYMKRDNGFMSWDVFKRIVDESAGKSKSCYLHQMGEPLLHHQLLDMIEYVNRAKIFSALSTNAVLLFEHVSERLFKSGLKHLILSMDAIDEEKYKSIRKGASLPQILRNIEKCIEIRKSGNFQTYIELQVINMKNNKGEFDKICEYMSDKLDGIGGITLKPYSFWAGHVSDLSIRDEIPKEFVCTMGNYSMSFLWNGDIVKCCMDYDGFTKVGNIKKQTIAEVWDSDEYKTFRAAHKNKDFSKLKFCKGCYLAHSGQLERYAEIREKLGERDYKPHLNNKTIAAIEPILTSESRVLETGSGNSTIWFARRAKSVTSFENISSWYYVLMDVIEEEKLTNIRLLFDKDYSKTSFHNFSGKFDVILLDGADNGSARVDCMKKAPDLLAVGGYLIVDDTHRTQYSEGIKFLDSFGFDKTVLFGKDDWREDKEAIIYKKEN